jgi:hypothetical protein
MARRKPQVMDIILRQVELEMLAGRNVDYLNGHIQLHLLELQLVTYSHGDTSWRCEHHENVVLSTSFRDSVCGDRLQYRRTHWRRANTEISGEDRAIPAIAGFRFISLFDGASFACALLFHRPLRWWSPSRHRIDAAAPRR